MNRKTGTETRFKQQQEARTVFAILAMLLIPAYLTIQSVNHSVIDGRSHFSIHLGYTWSLTLFAVPLVVILYSLLRDPKAHIPRKSLLWTLIVMLPASFLLDFVFANTFFVFPNGNATLGIKIWGLQFSPLELRRDLPIEEFIFYFLGMAVSLASYFWLSQVWFRKYFIGDDTEKVEEGDAFRDERLFEEFRIFRFRPGSAMIALGLAVLAVVYKKFGPHDYHEGWPLYFFYLLAFAFIPVTFFFDAVRRFINWRALAFSMLAMLLVSLFWEACLAIPFGWWGYNPNYMMGLTVLDWVGHQFGGPGLPVEATLVWIQVTFSMVIVYEVVRIVILRRDASRKGLLLKDVVTNHSPVLEARTEEEREAVFRFRYEACVDHPRMKALDSMDHESHRLEQQEDRWPESKIFYVKDGESVGAAVRFVRGSERIRGTEALKALELDRFQSFPMETMWFTQCLVVGPGRWKSLRISELLFHTYRLAMGQGGLFGFWLVDVGLVPHYRRIGYRVFTQNLQSPQKGLKIPMVLVGSDIGHLRSVDSPFTSIAREFPRNRESIEFFRSVFGTREPTAERLSPEHSRLALFDRLDEASPCDQWRLDRGDLDELLDQGRLLTLEPGDVLMEFGIASRVLYFLVDGLLVTQSEGGGDLPSRYLQPGEVLGETAYLLGDSLPAESVKAALPSKVVLIKNQDLREWMSVSPELSAKLFYRIAQALARRLTAHKAGSP